MPSPEGPRRRPLGYRIGLRPRTSKKAARFTESVIREMSRICNQSIGNVETRCGTADEMLTERDARFGQLVSIDQKVSVCNFDLVEFPPQHFQAKRRITNVAGHT